MTETPTRVVDPRHLPLPYWERWVAEQPPMPPPPPERPMVWLYGQVAR